ncbi:MAG: cobalamin-dependent protein [bacterium]|nr:MAG: cobalamin-dependent protein [bacterium]
MKVLLVEPPVSPYDVPTTILAMAPPHHLEIIAGALTSYHDVRIFDMRIEDDFLSVMSDFQPDIVGSSCVAANSHLAKSLLKQVKDFNREIFTVLGGHHPSLMPNDCDDDCVDAVVIGEGEETIVELTAKYETNRSLSNIRGIAFRDKDGNFKINPLRELMDLNTLPRPARNLTQKYRKKEQYFRASWRPIDCIISSRGCPFKCKFCGLWKINRGKYRYRDPELIADELETISDTFISFIDDNTLDHTTYAFQLAEIIKQRQLSKKFELYGRADTIARHPELVEKWRDVGMELLLVGLESCDNNALKEMNKHTTLEMNKKAIEICRTNGVELAAYLIVDPDFDHDDFKRLSEYVSQNNLTHPVFTVLSPFPGTDFYNEVKHKLITKSFQLLDFFHTVLPTKLPLDEFYEEFLNLYRNAYPTKNFIKAIFQGKAFLKPRMIVKNYKFRKRMQALRSHHDLIQATEHF